MAIYMFRDVPSIDFLLVGGGGTGGLAGYNKTSSGGGAGGVILCNGFVVNGCYNIVIGQGGDASVLANSGSPTAGMGGDSCFGDIVAYGGGRGGVSQSLLWQSRFSGAPRSGGSGGGGVRNSGNESECPGQAGCDGQGNSGGDPAHDYYGGWGVSGGGGGAGQAGGNGCICNGIGYGGKGGDGICSDISGELCWYGGGGGGGTMRNTSLSTDHGGDGGCGGGGNGSGCSNQRCSNATYYGGGGGGSDATPGYGYQGVFIARHLTACGYNITGGCCYTCGDYTIHCFTSNGTLCVN